MDKYAYKIGKSLYLNITNRCTNHCTFCVRYKTDLFNNNYSLWLNHEPTFIELKDIVSNPKMYKEIVFCGYGEPLSRIDLVVQLARYIKKRGGKVRIDTNGQANLIHGHNVLPQLRSLVDSMSISLNAQDAATYDKICHSIYGLAAFPAILEFIKQAKKNIKKVTVTAVNLPKVVDLEKCRQITKNLGVDFRVREYYEEEYPVQEIDIEK
ncbi:MAG: TatD family nuclease-associated radical SAM protein [Candidatus Margulisbacteria bacterium]|nr:TatD family nuclease-associated radical SAM protein [Candidatus Margulisiibacteriota bacterium]